MIRLIGFFFAAIFISMGFPISFKGYVAKLT